MSPTKKEFLAWVKSWGDNQPSPEMCFDWLAERVDETPKNVHVSETCIQRGHIKMKALAERTLKRVDEFWRVNKEAESKAYEREQWVALLERVQSEALASRIEWNEHEFLKFLATNRTPPSYLQVFDWLRSNVKIKPNEPVSDDLLDALKQAVDQLKADYVSTPLDGHGALIRKLEASIVAAEKRMRE